MSSETLPQGQNLAPHARSRPPRADRGGRGTRYAVAAAGLRPCTHGFPAFPLYTAQTQSTAHSRHSHTHTRIANIAATMGEATINVQKACSLLLSPARVCVCVCWCGATATRVPCASYLRLSCWRSNSAAERFRSVGAPAGGGGRAPPFSAICWRSRLAADPTPPGAP